MNFFDEMAGVWNKTCRYDTGKIEKVLSVLQLKQGDTVLDIGCLLYTSDAADD